MIALAMPNASSPDLAPAHAERSAREGYPIVHNRGFPTLFLLPSLARSIDFNHTCSSRVILATLLQPIPCEIQSSQLQIKQLNIRAFAENFALYEERNKPSD